MKKFRLSASCKRSLFSVVVACALMSGAGARGWAQDRETPANSPDSSSGGQQDKSPAPVNSTVPDSAPPSTPAVEVGQPASTPQADPFACSSLTTSDALPVVFVPGTAGSELRLTNPKRKLSDVLYWIGASTLSKNNLGLAPLNKEGNDIEGNEVTAPHALTAFSISRQMRRSLKKESSKAPLFEQDIYSNFLSWAKMTFRGGFCEAPYDWRKGATPDSAARVERAVNEAMERTGQPSVILLAHSLGGIVARDYIVQKGGTKVAALIAVGTPWLGTPKTARALLWGYNFGVGLLQDSNKKLFVAGAAESFEGAQCPPEGCPCPGSWCPVPRRISLFKMQATADLARNFPAVYQQLPMEEFMNLYGKFYGQPFRPVILGMKDWKEVKDFYRSDAKGNDILFDRAEEQRKRNLDGDSRGVSHYLIAGVYSKDCRLPEKERPKKCNTDNVMDMQMAQRQQIRRTFGFKLWSFSLKTANLIFKSITGLILGRGLKLGIYEDPYVAIDSHVDWGDGTSPLLSATAGEYLRGRTGPHIEGAASKFLGPGTVVETVTLGPEYPHAFMLYDREVRQKLARIYSDENKERKLSTSLGEAGEDVNSLSIELFLESKAEGQRIKVLFPYDEQEIITRIKGMSGEITFQEPTIRDAHIIIPRDYSTDPLGVRRNLRTNDLGRVSLTLQNMGGKNLSFARYQLKVNDKVCHEGEGFELFKTTTFVIQLQPCQAGLPLK
jgi:pimeloyl-ACP methyl ester carboxylesterase